MPGKKDEPSWWVAGFVAVLTIAGIILVMTGVIKFD
jgi:hypothetical protein